ncbi:MAG: leucyl/phenylalanyl-tRNA--protein transferase [Gammaproteobacteria bacterium]|nr:leucyl/phenylalanyl-tRNA--protein transferase [Gammaproteobacteria bacterium]
MTRGVPRFYWIAAQRYGVGLPPVDEALTEPNGLLAAHGDLEPASLLEAYRRGVFPWFSAGQPILWWSPDPRAVLYPSAFHVSRSLARTLRRGHFEVTIDRDFAGVMHGCAAPRRDGGGTWITDDMFDAYATLHRQGHAHSVECRHDGELVGGMYGVAIGRVFFGESMFSRMTDASKVALATACGLLAAWDYALFDCQVSNPHLVSLGAVLLPRTRFVTALSILCGQEPAKSAWRVLEEQPAR